MARLTTAQRNALPDSAFAGPDRTYPVNDAAHARAAKAMSHGARSGKPASPAVQAAVARKVKKKFPRIGKSRDERVKAMSDAIRG